MIMTTNIHGVKSVALSPVRISKSEAHSYCSRDITITMEQEGGGEVSYTITLFGGEDPTPLEVRI